MKPLTTTEFLLNTDGSVYHLQLKPEHVAETIITVGDPERVAEVSKHFERIEYKIQNREFVTHTGFFKNGKRVTVISTGIGTDNVEIVITEIDALFNIDFETRLPKSKITSLNFIRIGTTGTIKNEIALDSFLVAESAIGLDNLMHFYDAPNNSDELLLADALAEYIEKKNEDLFIFPYAFSASKTLLAQFCVEPFIKSITVTTPGFYAPQGRAMRTKLTERNLVFILGNFNWKNTSLTNFEMETSALYGMARVLGHHAISVSAVLANRVQETFSTQSQVTINKLIEKVIEIISRNDE